VAEGVSGGLQVGDVIIEVNGNSCLSAAELNLLLVGILPGEVV
jgi:hypothetical protein